MRLSPSSTANIVVDRIVLMKRTFYRRIFRVGLERPTRRTIKTSIRFNIGTVT